jgi:hypothetical protein
MIKAVKWPDEEQEIIEAEFENVPGDTAPPPVAGDMSGDMPGMIGDDDTMGNNLKPNAGLLPSDTTDMLASGKAP